MDEVDNSMIWYTMFIGFLIGIPIAGFSAIPRRQRKLPGEFDLPSQKTILTAGIDPPLDLIGLLDKFVASAEGVRPYSSMPGPPLWPVLGNMPQTLAFLKQQAHAHHVIWTQFANKYGGIYRYCSCQHCSKMLHNSELTISHCCTLDLPSACL